MLFFVYFEDSPTSVRARSHTLYAEGKDSAATEEPDNMTAAIASYGAKRTSAERPLLTQSGHSQSHKTLGFCSATASPTQPCPLRKGLALMRRDVAPSSDFASSASTNVGGGISLHERALAGDGERLCPLRQKINDPSFLHVHVRCGRLLRYREPPYPSPDAVRRARAAVLHSPAALPRRSGRLPFDWQAPLDRRS